jgi:hypothetical protein
VLGQEDNRARELAADGHALKHPEQHDQKRRCNPDRSVGGQQAHCDGGDGHHRDRNQQRSRPSVPVADVAEDDGADGTHEESHRECAESRQ